MSKNVIFTADELIKMADTRGRRAYISKAMRKRIIESHGGRCFYCGGESKSPNSPRFFEA